MKRKPQHSATELRNKRYRSNIWRFHNANHIAQSYVTTKEISQNHYSDKTKLKPIGSEYFTRAPKIILSFENTFAENRNGCRERTGSQTMVLSSKFPKKMVLSSKRNYMTLLKSVTTICCDQVITYQSNFLSHGRNLSITFLPEEIGIKNLSGPEPVQMVNIHFSAGFGCLHVYSDVLDKQNSLELHKLSSTCRINR